MSYTLTYTTPDEDRLVYVNGATFTGTYSGPLVIPAYDGFGNTVGGILDYAFCYQGGGKPV